MGDNAWRVVIPGKPIPKGRPRASVVKRGGRLSVNMRTPDRTEAWEVNAIAAIVRTARPVAIEGPVWVRMDFCFDIPKSLSKAEREQRLNGKYHTMDPDIDNLAKAALDALVRAKVIKDDCQVYKMSCEKLWTERAETIITVYW